MKDFLLSDFSFRVGRKKVITSFVLSLINNKKSFTLLPTSLNDLASVDSDFSLRKSYQRIDYCLTDGMPLVWFFNLKKFFQRDTINVERIYGPILMRDILRQGNKDVRHFFYGSSENTLGMLKQNLKKLAPQTKIIEMVSPPFRELTLKEEATYLALIRSSDIDVLWIGLSSPKQVVLAARWNQFLPNTAIMCVGAAFDFLADRQAMAPKFVQMIGLEWLFRLSIEPRRLWRRYLVVIPSFIIRKVSSYFFD